MNIGSTPTHTFVMPSWITPSSANKIQIIYSQENEVVLTKTKTDCTISGQNVSVVLTQADTFLFDGDKRVEIQVRVKSGSVVAASDLIITDARKCLDTNVL